MLHRKRSNGEFFLYEVILEGSSSAVKFRFSCCMVFFEALMDVGHISHHQLHDVEEFSRKKKLEPTRFEWCRQEEDHFFRFYFLTHQDSCIFCNHLIDILVLLLSACCVQEGSKIHLGH